MDLGCLPKDVLFNIVAQHCSFPNYSYLGFKMVSRGNVPFFHSVI